MTTNAAPITNTTLRAEGFTCPSCVTKLETLLSGMPGVERVKVHYSTERIEVSHDAGQSSAESLAAAVTKAGYPARPSAF